MAYFYFDCRDGQANFQLQNKLICCLISQFADMQHKGVPLELEKLYKNSKFQQPQDKHLEDILDSVLSGIPHAYVVIDALDECTNREKVLIWLSKVMQKLSNNMHILITSRPFPDIAKAFGKLYTTSVNMEENTVNSDIVKYLKSKIENKFEDLNESIKAQIQNVLIQKAEGS